MVCIRTIISGMVLLLLTAQCFPQTERRVTVNLSVKDHFSEQPLESARAILFYRGEELSSVLTNAQGQASIVHTITGVTELQGGAFALGHCFPNPFSATAAAHLLISEAQTITARVINLLGAEMVSLQQFLEPGNYLLELALGSLPPGIYFLSVKGLEHASVRLVKTGSGGEGAPLSIAIAPAGGITAKLPLAATEKSDDDKLHLPDYAIEVSKEAYSTKTLSTALTQDTTMLYHMKRLNKVAFAAVDEDGEAHETEVLIKGEYFQQRITTPDTLLMHAGHYTISTDMPFLKPLETSFSLAVSDTSVLLSVEKMDAMIYDHADPQSNILFVADHISGLSLYYHGLKENDKHAAATYDIDYEGMHLTHFVLDYGDGTKVILIFNEVLYPIMWVADHYVISVRKPRHQSFDPYRAMITVMADEVSGKGLNDIQPGSWHRPISTPALPKGASTTVCHPPDALLTTTDPALQDQQQHKALEDTLTLDISVGNLYGLIDWLEAETGDSFELARDFLARETSSWAVLRERAISSGPYQGDYLRLAAAFSLLASAKAFSEATEADGKGISAFMNDGPHDQKIPFSPFPSLSVPNPTSVGAGALGCALNAAVERANTDRSGITVPIYVCRGSTAWSNICQNAVFTGPVSRCVARCKTSMDCFIDICAPDVMNIQRVLQVRERQ